MHRKHQTCNHYWTPVGLIQESVINYSERAKRFFFWPIWGSRVCNSSVNEEWQESSNNQSIKLNLLTVWGSRFALMDFRFSAHRLRFYEEQKMRVFNGIQGSFRFINIGFSPFTNFYFSGCCNLLKLCVAEATTSVCLQVLANWMNVFIYAAFKIGGSEKFPSWIPRRSLFWFQFPRINMFHSFLFHFINTVHSY